MPSVQKRQAVGFVACLLVAAAIIFRRYPELFLHPRFWAEEGTGYFAQIRGLPIWKALTFLDFGYYNLYANIAAYCAGKAPLESAPAVTTFFALFGILAPIAVIFSGTSEFWGKAHWKKFFAAFLLLYSPHLPDVWLTSIHAQFFFCIATFLIVLEDASTLSQVRKFFYRALLLIGGLSGLLSCFLIPVFAWDWIVNRNKERFLQIGLLSACAVLQLVCIGFFHHASDGVSSRLHLPTLTTLTFIFANRVIFAPLVGLVEAESFASHLTSLSADMKFRLALLLGAALVFFLLSLARGVEKSFRYRLMGGLLLVFCLSLFGTLANESQLVFPGDSSRYFLVPTYIFYLIVLSGIRLPSRDKPLWQAFMVALLAAQIWAVATAYQGVIRQFQHGADWQEEVAKWRANPDTPLEVWPDWEHGRTIKISPL